MSFQIHYILSSPSLPTFALELFFKGIIYILSLSYLGRENCRVLDIVDFFFQPTLRMPYE